jgi:hypothetical protein
VTRATHRLWIACLVLASLLGCVTPRTPICKKPIAEQGWVTIAGSSVPGATVTVESYGKSLVQCLNESQTTSILASRAKWVGIPAPRSIEMPTESDLKSALSLLEAPLSNKSDKDFEKEWSVRHELLVEKLIALQRDFPRLAIPDSWALGWPHCLIDDPTNVNGMEQLAYKIGDMPESQFKEEAKRGYRKLQGKKLSNQDRAGFVTELSALARDGKIELDPEEKIRAWSFTSIGAVNKSSDTSAEPIAQFKERASSFAKELKARQVLDRPSSKFTVNGFDNSAVYSTPDEALMVLIQSAGRERVLLPLEMVFESELGGLWLFPGDRIEIVRFKELPVSRGEVEEGDCRVGVLGLITTQGVLLTKNAVASSVISDVVSDVDSRANLLVITNEWNGQIVHTLLPYGASQVSSATQANVDSLLERWAIQDGTLIKFDLSQLSPMMVRSRAYQQRAASEIAKIASQRDQCELDCMPQKNANGSSSIRAGNAVRDVGSNLWDCLPKL